MAIEVRIGTAGWSIPRAVADRFPSEGTGLQRYAAVFSAVEVNTSFYRPHKLAIWRRWADATPPDFRFSAKAPKVITHERRLIDCGEPVRRFLDETSGLGDKLGAVLFQTPASLPFDPAAFAAFTELWRQVFGGPTVWEPRHPSWFSPEAEAALTGASIARVAADPPPKGVDGSIAGRPGGWSGLAYHRLHGAPRMYVTPYDEGQLDGLASESVARAGPTWLMFDNTMSGAAADNALSLLSKIRPRQAR